jgi:hypothetical protein
MGRRLFLSRRCAGCQIGDALFVDRNDHESVSLEPHWQMMGALEALNGMLLFGLTTAFLFAMIQEVWPLARREGRRGR